MLVRPFSAFAEGIIELQDVAKEALLLVYAVDDPLLCSAATTEHVIHQGGGILLLLRSQFTGNVRPTIRKKDG